MQNNLAVSNILIFGQDQDKLPSWDGGKHEK